MSNPTAVAVAIQAAEAAIDGKAPESELLEVFAALCESKKFSLAGEVVVSRMMEGGANAGELMAGLLTATFAAGAAAQSALGGNVCVAGDLTIHM